MIHACKVCEAELGPWEALSCLSCDSNTRPIWSVTNSDAGVQILERGDGPLSVYDIQRGIHREFGKEVLRGSLAASISVDPRFCWAGKGLYGLYRHKLVPGPRNLAGDCQIFSLRPQRSADTSATFFFDEICGIPVSGPVIGERVNLRARSAVGWPVGLSSS